MAEQASNNSNRNRGLIILFLALIVLTAGGIWAFNGAGKEEKQSYDIVLMNEPFQEKNVLYIDEENIPAIPKPKGAGFQLPVKVDTSAARTVFTAERGDRSCFEYLEGEFVKPDEVIPCINPYSNQKGRSVFDIEQRPHFKNCLDNGKYTAMSFGCTKDKVFEHVRHQLKVPACVSHSGVNQTVLALVLIDELGQVEKVRVLNTDDVCMEASVEAIRVLKTLPGMEPGVYGGMPIKVSFSIPIKFTAN